MTNKNLIPIINLLRYLSLSELRNAEVVANLVRAFGIMNWGPNAAGPEARYISGGCAIGQTPDQIAKALEYLSWFEIDTFCEVGLYYGGNFLFTAEYLKRFNPGIKCTGVDPNDYLDAEIKERIAGSGWLTLEATTSDRMAGRKFDFVFIDGDHAAPWPAKDYESLGKFAKICGFHDLQDPLWGDVGRFWATLPDEGMVKKVFLDDLSGKSSHGIGLIHRKGIK